MDAHPKTQEVYTKHPYTIFLFIALKGIKTPEIAGKMSDFVQHLVVSLSAIKGISNTALITLAVPHLGDIVTH